VKTSCKATHGPLEKRGTGSKEGVSGMGKFIMQEALLLSRIIWPRVSQNGGKKTLKSQQVMASRGRGLF